MATAVLAAEAQIQRDQGDGVSREAGVQLGAVLGLRDEKALAFEAPPQQRAHLDRVGAHAAKVGWALHVQRVAVCGDQRLDCCDHIGHQLRDGKGLQLYLHAAGLDLREVEDVVDQGQ